MQYILLKSRALIRFNPNKCPFVFNEYGYFVGDVSLNSKGAGSPAVKSFTFHISEMSCHWVQ
jgi:hypothetical protein